jgi:hypothetical protein
MATPDHSNSGFSQGRRLLNWLNLLLAAAAALAVVVMVNYVAGGHYKRFHMDRDSDFKLSEQTVHVLDSLTNDVEITIFFEPHGQNEEIYGLTAALLTEYQQACPRYIHVHTLDYDREIGAAKEFLTKSGQTNLSEKDFVQIESGGATKVVYAKELASYDYNDLITGRGKYVRRNAYLGEMYFSRDIYDVCNPRQLKACFLTGHGENDPGNNRENVGYSKLAAMIKTDDNGTWTKLSLQGTNRIPADCALLIVAASEKEGKIPVEELAKIATYLKQGGRLLALLTVRSGLESVLMDWGIHLGNDNNRIRELDENFKITDTTFLTAKLGTHVIMDPLAGGTNRMPLMMVLPREVWGEQSKIPGAPQITILAATSPQGSNEFKQRGSFGLLAAVEQGDIQGVNSPGGRGTRIVVAGDSDFLDDQAIDSVGNHLFAHQALGWLLQQPQMMLSGLGPRPIKEFKTYITPAHERTLRWLLLVGMPGGVLLLGGLVWLRRRS